MAEPVISLLHATYRSGRDAIAVRETWFRLASCPERIEHVFAYNIDDEISAGVPEISDGGIAGSAMPGMVTAVRNWNLAASRSCGSLLIVIADDLVPEAGWDEDVLSILCDLDPRLASVVIKVCDGKSVDEHLIRHPIVTRRFYERFGLFRPIYQGIGADNEFTLEAHARGMVLDGRAVTFHHAHPTLGAAPTESHLELASSAQVQRGKALFESRWPLWRRRLFYLYVRPRSGHEVVEWWQSAGVAALSRTGYLGALMPAAARRKLRELAGRTIALLRGDCS